MASEHRAITAVERAYLDAILAAPTDDSPRLVYADWLQREGDPLHGELINVQCALAQLGGAPADELPRPDGQRRARLRAREAQLLAAPELAWLSPAMTLSARCFGGSMRPRRGFIDSGAMASRPSQLLASHRGLERYAPFARRMRLLGCPGAELELLLEAGALSRFTALELHDDPAYQGRPARGQRAPLPSLTKLELRQLALPAAFVEQLFARPLPALEQLVLDECLLSQGSLPSLVAHAPPRLRKLKASRCMGSDEFDQLAQLGLDELHLAGGWIPREATRRLRRAIPRCVIRSELLR